MDAPPRMTHPLFYHRTPTAAVMGITQKEMYAHHVSQGVALSFLREQVTILANTMEAQAHNCTTTDAMVAQMKHDMKDLNKAISEKEHPLRYLLAAQRNDMTNLAGTVQMLSDNLNKVIMSVNEMAVIVMKLQSNTTVPEDSPCDVHRTPTTPVNMNNIYGNHPPMLSPTPTRAESYATPTRAESYAVENVD